MDLEEKLNNYQKKRITERLELDFDKENNKETVEKKRFIINFYNELNIFNTELYNNGVLFYGFSIKMPFFENTDPDLWYYIHLQVENWVSEFRDRIELIEFCYLSIELENDKRYYRKNNTVKEVSIQFNKTENVPYIKGIIGVRSLIGKNKNHFNEIKKFFNITCYDIKVKELHTLSLIKKYWNFILKEQNFKFHRFCQYSRYFEQLYGSISDLELQYDDDHFAFNLDEELNSKCRNLQGIQDLNPYSQTVINYLFTIYMLEEDLILIKNKVYRKNDYSYIGGIDFLQKNNIKIIEKLKLKYPQQLGKLNIPKLFAEGWDKFYADIKKNNHYLPQ